MPETGPTHTEPAPRAGAAPDAPPFRYRAELAGEIESKWQSRWEAERTFQAPNPGDPGFDRFEGSPKKYVLDMFPYPSGAGLHVGHPLGYIATDIFARYCRMTGHNVLHAMGYDAFGLPAEQYAVQTGQHPRITTENNIARMRQQLRRLGLGHDAHRSVATTDVPFVRWTQWIFLQIFNSFFDAAQNKARPISELIAEFESGARDLPDGRDWADLDATERRAAVDRHRLAYLDEIPVNWCPALGTVLANEEVTADGRSERGNYPVFKRPLKQWMMRITAFAERLLDDLEIVDWPEPVKLMQRNWIGRSEGASIDFDLEAIDDVINVYSTRPDTLYGATFMVLAPEHPLVDRIVPDAWPEFTRDAWKGDFPGADHTMSPRETVAAYRRFVESRSDVERQKEDRDKTGVFTGAMAINPMTREPVVVFIADYVLMGYGSGAIMAVPAHDERDFEFARKFDLRIRDVVYPRPIHALRWFVDQIEGEDDFAHGWELAAADFLGLIASKNIEPAGYEKALRQVRSLRELPEKRADESLGEPAQPGAVGGERGAVQTVWLEAVSDLLTLGLDGLRELFDRAGYVQHTGSAIPEPGLSVNSDVIDDLPREEATAKIIEELEARGAGSGSVNYKLRDWLFSRQRYWGEPFPIVYDETDMPIALPESMLPVELPEMEDFAPRVNEDDAQSAPVPEPPLGRSEEWKTVELDLGDGPRRYRRELNTMPQWAGSCWYYLRYLDPDNEHALCAPKTERYWMAPSEFNPAGGVDLYVGGAEHAVLHLLYARFWHKVLFDLGHVSTPEPFGKLFNQGYIQAYAYTDERGVYVDAERVEEESPNSGKFLFEGKPVDRQYGKMGKSLRNAVAPDDICQMYGADTLRLYEMYLGPLDASKPWNTRDIIGVHRFLQRLWRNLIDEQTGELRIVDIEPDEDTLRALHKTIAGVRDDMASLGFNTAIAKLIELNNHLTKVVDAHDGAPRVVADALVRMLAPLTPHVAEELWEKLGHDESIAWAGFPVADESLLVEDTVELPVQIGGKVRGRISVSAEADSKQIEDAALADEDVKRFLEGKTVRKVIVVPGRLVNIVAN